MPSNTHSKPNPIRSSLRQAGSAKTGADLSAACVCLLEACARLDAWAGLPGAAGRLPVADARLPVAGACLDACARVLPPAPLRCHARTLIQANPSTRKI